MSEARQAWEAHKNHPDKATYTWEAIAPGDVVIEEFDGSAERKFDSLPKPPYKFIAKPHNEGMPTLSVDIEPGQSPIWGHRSRFAIGLIANSTTEYESLLFGRTLADGTEEVQEIHPDGEVLKHESFNAALSHSR